jgi:hypothetical protein
LVFGDEARGLLHTDTKRGISKCYAGLEPIALAWRHARVLPSFDGLWKCLFSSLVQRKWDDSRKTNTGDLAE